MAIGIHHVHVKTRDPKQTLQFYVENLGATLIADRGPRGYQVNLHGLQLNITPIIDSQTREQHYGIEPIAVDTDDYAGLVTGGVPLDAARCGQIYGDRRSHGTN